MLKGTSRLFDQVLSDNVSAFIDIYFYSKLVEAGHSVERIYEKELQLKGVDVIINGINIDEKVKVKSGYISKLIDYPSFEVMSKISDGKYVDGWFVAENNVTDYIAFISVFSDVEDWHDIRFENIDKVVMLFVKKKDVLNHIGVTQSILKRDAKELIQDYPLMMNERKEYPLARCYLKYSVNSGYPENPVNLVIRRNELLKIESTKEIEVNKNFWMKLI